MTFFWTQNDQAKYLSPDKSRKSEQSGPLTDPLTDRSLSSLIRSLIAV